jgi:hypothetical protein
MCDVCVADGALRPEGIKITWDDAPRTARAVVFYGRGYAEGPASYSLRIDGVHDDLEERDTDSLAGIAWRYGLDVRWPYVPPLVQRWVCGRGPKPTLTDLYAARRQRRRGHQPATARTRAVETLLSHFRALRWQEQRPLTKADLALLLRTAERRFAQEERRHRIRAAKAQAQARTKTKAQRRAQRSRRLMNNLRVYDQTPATP